VGAKSRCLCGECDEVPWGLVPRCCRLVVPLVPRPFARCPAALHNREIASPIKALRRWAVLRPVGGRLYFRCCLQALPPKCCSAHGACSRPLRARARKNRNLQELASFRGSSVAYPSPFCPHVLIAHTFSMGAKTSVRLIRQPIYYHACPCQDLFCLGAWVPVAIALATLSAAGIAFAATRAWRNGRRNGLETLSAPRETADAELPKLGETSRRQSRAKPGNGKV